MHGKILKIFYALKLVWQEYDFSFKKLSFFLFLCFYICYLFLLYIYTNEYTRLSMKPKLCQRNCKIEIFRFLYRILLYIFTLPIIRDYQKRSIIFLLQKFYLFEHRCVQIHFMTTFLASILKKKKNKRKKRGEKGKKRHVHKKKKKEKCSGRYSNLTVSHVCHKPWFFHRRTKYAHTFPWKSLENNKRARYQGHKYSFSRDRISPSYPLGDFYRDKLRRRTPIASCQLFLRDDVSATALRCR